MKIHLHSEQFDGYLHAECGRLDSDVRYAPHPNIVGTDDFEAAPARKRCRICARANWPHGGED